MAAPSADFSGTRRAAIASRAPRRAKTGQIAGSTRANGPRTQAGSISSKPQPRDLPAPAIAEGARQPVLMAQPSGQRQHQAAADHARERVDGMLSQEWRSQCCEPMVTKKPRSSSPSATP